MAISIRAVNRKRCDRRKSGRRRPGEERLVGDGRRSVEARDHLTGAGHGKAALYCVRLIIDLEDHGKLVCG